VADSSELAEIIQSFYNQISVKPEARSRLNLVKKNSREKALAFGLSLALWFVLVHESKIIYRTYTVPIEHEQLSDSLVLSDLEPKEVEVTLSGQRKTFYLSNTNEIKLTLKPWAFKKGENTIAISTSNLSFPENLVLEKVEPNRIIAIVKQKSQPAKDMQ